MITILLHCEHRTNIWFQRSWKIITIIISAPTDGGEPNYIMMIINGSCGELTGEFGQGLHRVLFVKILLPSSSRDPLVFRWLPTRNGFRSRNRFYWLPTSGSLSNFQADRPSNSCCRSARLSFEAVKFALRKLLFGRLFYVIRSASRIEEREMSDARQINFYLSHLNWPGAIHRSSGSAGNQK